MISDVIRAYALAASIGNDYTPIPYSRACFFSGYNTKNQRKGGPRKKNMNTVSRRTKLKHRRAK